MRTLNFIFIALLVFAMLIGCQQQGIMSDPTPADDDPNSEAFLLKKFSGCDPGIVKVMTRNIYVGTDFDMILGAEDPNLIPFYVAQAFELLQNTNFYERADALAKEVKWVRPHLIGLQEVSTIRHQSPGDYLAGNPQPAEIVLYDYLEILMAAFSAHGLQYEVAVIGQNIDIELPMVTEVDPETGYPVDFDDVRLTDHDVILVRQDVAYSDAAVKRYAQELPVNELISVPSGYVAVKATIGDKSYRFVNTHLDAGPVEDIRLAQAYELLTDLAGETLPIIMLGDFNTPAPENSTYQFIMSQGYNDAWLERRWGMWQDTQRLPSDSGGWNVCATGSASLLAWQLVHCPSSNGLANARLFVSQ